jgi:hypothetical protein
MIRPFLRTNLLLWLALCCTAALHAQGTLGGKVFDAETNAPLADVSVVVSATGKFAASSTDGTFEITGLTPGAYTLVVSHAGYLPFETQVDTRTTGDQKLAIALSRDATTNTPTDIPTVTLDEAESETEGAGEIANLLHANRDVFQNIAGFGWSFFRFRERGYESEQFPVLLNGVPINDPETGTAFFGEFGGLNDVLRNRNSIIGLNPAEFAFSGIGGATMIDTRASIQRKQVRASYASTNRLYRNRVMLTASTGLLPGNWAVSVSGSHRWAEEGYIPGTFFDAWSYFLSVDKKFGTRHAVNLTVIGAQNKRGRAADSFQEMYDLAGTNYYNPLWGFQNGEKRNSQVQTNHQPLALVRYDWTPETNTAITAAVYAQGGVNSFTRLNWLDAANPAPDFNRRLPSSLLDLEQQNAWTDQLSADEALRQIDWHGLYYANRRNPETVLNADGVAGNSFSGNRSLYIVEDQRSDSREAGGSIFVRHTAADRLTINGGLNYQWYRGENYKLVDDLLGGDYWLDRDFFSLFDGPENRLAGNSDVRVPDNVVREGDIFGYNYNENIRTADAWVQTLYNGTRFQYFAALNLAHNGFWRTGLMQNGRFPDNSLGDSERRNFNTYGVKGGVVWKANGRNYVYANGFHGTQSPRFRDAFLSPRVRANIVPNLDVSTVQSIEGGYLLRSPYYRARVTAFLTDFKNETESIFASAMSVSRVMDNIDLGGLNLDDDDTFLQAPVFFGSAVLQGVGRRHTGVEAAIEAKPLPAWTFTAAAMLGRYVYTERPSLLLSLDNSTVPVLDAGLVYQKNFYVPRTPQTAGSVAIRYEGRQFWFATLTANYADNLYYDFDRLRRTTRFVESLDRGNETWTEIIDQKKADEAFTLDFFGGKSWRIRTKYFLYVNLGVNNILNNQNVVIAGRDSYRNAFRNDVSDGRFYTSELTYAPGINYFASIAIRI